MWKWIKIPKAVALLAFVLPWMTVSCSGTKLVSATGLGLSFGRFTSELDSNAQLAAQQSHTMNWWLVLALALIVVGLAIAFLAATRRNALIVLGTSITALVLILAGTARYSKSAMLQEIGKRRGELATQIDHTADAMIQIDWHFGYWLALAALVASAVIAWLSFSGRDTGPA